MLMMDEGCGKLRAVKDTCQVRSQNVGGKSLLQEATVHVKPSADASSNKLPDIRGVEQQVQSSRKRTIYRYSQVNTSSCSKLGHRGFNYEVSTCRQSKNPTLRMQREWFTLLIPSNMCPACGIWDLKHFFPANDSSVPLVCWRLPTTKQSWHSADRPDLWLLFCSLLLSLWLQAICRTQTASLFPHHGSALKVLIPIPQLWVH